MCQLEGKDTYFFPCTENELMFYLKHARVF